MSSAISHSCSPHFFPLLDPGPHLKTQMPCVTREVNAFTTSAYQKNTKNCGPPPTDFLCIRRGVGDTFFKERYKRSEIPVHLGNVRGEYGWDIIWRANIEELDADFYIPVFLEGLIETEHPYNYLAYRGALELFYAHRCKVLELLPKIVPYFARAFKSRVGDVLLATINLFRHFVCLEPRIGPALIKYYHTFLPILNYYYAHFTHGKSLKLANMNYSEKNRRDLQRELESMLGLMEQAGGPKAFAEIKFYIHTYESAFF